MKALLVAVTLVTLASVKARHLTQNEKAIVYRLHQECKDQTGVDEKAIHQLKAAEKVEDPKMRQYIFCISKKFGFQNEEGEFQKDVIRTKLMKYSEDQERIDTIVNNCTVKKEDAEEAAVSYFLCHIKNTPQNGDYVFFYVAKVTKEQHEKLKEHKALCMKETGVKPDVLPSIEKGNFPDETDFKAFVLCVSKRIGIQNNEGKLDEKVAREKLGSVLKDADKVENVMKLCLRERNNAEETAYQMLKCFHDKFYFNILQEDTIGEDEKKKLLGYHELCKNESGILPEELEQAKKGNFSDSDTFKKHLFCMYRRCGIVDEKGLLDKEEFFERYSKRADKEEVERVYEKCNIDDDTPENNSFKIFSCFWESVPNATNFFTIV